MATCAAATARRRQSSRWPRCSCSCRAIAGDRRGYYATFIPQSYLGSNGIFIALILGLVLPPVLNFLLKHVSIKLPDSVPDFVAKSLSPTFAAIIILTGLTLVAWGMTLTPFGNVYDFVSQIVAAPDHGRGAPRLGPTCSSRPSPSSSGSSVCILPPS